VITSEEIREALKERSIYATKQDIDLLVERFDVNHDGKISYNEFVKELKPKSPQLY